MFDFDKFNEVLNEELKTHDGGSWINRSRINEDGECVFDIKCVVDDMECVICIGGPEYVESKGRPLSDYASMILKQSSDDLWGARNKEWDKLPWRDGGFVFIHRRDDDFDYSDAQMDKMFELASDESVGAQDINKALSELRASM